MSYHSMGLTPENFDRSTLPQLDSAKIEMLWHDSWYDGPLTGVIEYEGEKHYFDLYCPDEDDYGYQYVTIKLVEAEYLKLKADHERFQAAVKGYHERFDGKGLVWDAPECKAYWKSVGFPQCDRPDKDEFVRENTFYRKERITGYFCERGTTKQQFAAIKVFNKDGELL